MERARKYLPRALTINGEQRLGGPFRDSQPESELDVALGIYSQMYFIAERIFCLLNDQTGTPP
jgi:hypothetical protein